METLGLLVLMLLVIALGLGWLFLLGNIGSFSVAGRWVIGGGTVLLLYLLFTFGGGGSDCPDPSDCRWTRS
jgi:hypothetical protein